MGYSTVNSKIKEALNFKAYRLQGLLGLLGLTNNDFSRSIEYHYILDIIQIGLLFGTGGW